MIHVMIICKELQNLIQLSASVRRGIDTSACIVTTAKAEEALSIIKRKQIRFDLFIIEVQLDGQSGYKLESAIRQSAWYSDAPILFITKESFKITGSSYLATYENYKKRNYISLPLENIDVQGKIGLYLDSIVAKQIRLSRDNRSVCLDNSGGLNRVRIRDILFLEVQSKVCTVHTLTDKYTLNRQSLSSMLAWLNSDDIIRCHRFYAVNARRIKTIERLDRRNWLLYLDKSSLTCPASQTYIRELRSRRSSIE